MKRTLSGELSPTPLPVQAGAPTGTAQDNTALPPAAPDVHTQQPNQDILADWMNAANEALPDLNSLLQQIPDTPPVLNARNGEASVEESSDAESEDSHDYHFPFERAFAELLDESRYKPAFSLDSRDIAAPSPEQRRALVNALGSNTVTKVLTLRDVNCEGMLAAIAEGMANNTALRALNFSGFDTSDRYICPAGSGVWLANMLKTNQHLKELNITCCYELTTHDYLQLFEALKDNCTLKKLFAEQPSKYGAKDLEITQEHIEKLAANQHLRELSLPWWYMTREAFVAFADILQTHPTLTALGLGDSSVDQLQPLWSALKKNVRINFISIGFSHCYEWSKPDWDWDKDPSFSLAYDPDTLTSPPKSRMNKEQVAARFEVLSRCAGLSSVSLGDLDEFDSLVDFLKANPRIREVHLWFDIKRLESTEKLAGLLEFAKSCSQLTYFNFTEGDTKLNDTDIKFLNNLIQQTELNLENSANLPAAAAGMSVMLGVQRDEPAALPELPIDVTQQVAEAVLQNLISIDAQTVFNALAPYGEVSAKMRNKS